VFTFHKFARLLGSDFPSYGMKAIGVDGTEPPPDRVEVIAARYLEEILAARPNGPYVLAGYSVGGLMAFELGLQMQRRGIDVARVIVFDTLAPGYPRPLPWPVRMGIHFLNFLSLSGERKWKYLGERFRNTRHRILTAIGLGHLDLQHEPNVGGLSDHVLKRVWAALERAWHRYRPTEKFQGPITLVRSDLPEHWAATRLDDPLNGWARWSTQPIHAIGAPVGHMEFFSEANLDLMVTEMRRLIPLRGGNRGPKSEVRNQKSEVSAH
jgi:thioesterase domain-containing protein